MENIKRDLERIKAANRGDTVVNDLVDISLALIAYMNTHTTTELYARILQLEQMAGIRSSRGVNLREESRSLSGFDRYTPNSWRDNVEF